MSPSFDSFYLNAMDPGGTTGLTLLKITPWNYTVERQAAVPYEPLEGASPIRTLESWRDAFDDGPHVMTYEDFHIRPGKYPDPAALKVIGALEEWASVTHYPAWAEYRLPGRVRAARRASVTEMPSKAPYRRIVTQEPVQAKREETVNDAVLSRLDLKAYGPMSQHINDAFRHAVSWLSTWGYLPVCQKAWPRRTLATAV